MPSAYDILRELLYSTPMSGLSADPRNRQSATASTGAIAAGATGTFNVSASLADPIHRGDGLLIEFAVLQLSNSAPANLLSIVDIAVLVTVAGGAAILPVSQPSITSLGLRNTTTINFGAIQLLLYEDLLSAWAGAGNTEATFQAGMPLRLAVLGTLANSGAGAATGTAVLNLACRHVHGLQEG